MFPLFNRYKLPLSFGTALPFSSGMSTIIFATFYAPTVSPLKITSTWTSPRQPLKRWASTWSLFFSRICSSSIPSGTYWLASAATFPFWSAMRARTAFTWVKRVRRRAAKNWSAPSSAICIFTWVMSCSIKSQMYSSW